MRISFWAACALAAGLAAPSRAQERTEPATGRSSAPAAMTLEQALAYAAVHQPSLQAARARLEAAKSARGEASGLWLPKLGATAQALEATANNSSASYFSTGALDIPRIGGTRAAPPASWTPEASTFAGVGARQELFDFGRIRALSVIYDAQAQAEAARADASRLDVAALVEESFYGVRAAAAVLEAARAAQQRVSLHRDQAAAGVRSGLRSPIELTRAEAELARMQLGTLRAEGGLAVARAIFAAAVGAPSRTLDALAGEPPPTAAPDLSNLDAFAERDPAVRAAHAQLLEQQGITRQARSELMPELFVSGGINARAGGAQPSSGAAPAGGGALPSIPNWDVGIVLSWPIFDATSLARASASKAREAERAAEESQARLQFSAQVQQSAEMLDVSTLALPALRRAVEAAAANYAQADARFGAGLGSSVELADAEALRLQADIELAVGQFDQARARSRLARALAEGL